MIDGAVEGVAVVEKAWNGVLKTIRQPLHLYRKILCGDRQEALRAHDRSVEIGRDLAIDNIGKATAIEPASCRCRLRSPGPVPRTGNTVYLKVFPRSSVLKPLSHQL